MTSLERLLELGASPVGPDLVLKGKVLGHILPERQVLLTPEGEAALAIEDVVVKSETTAPAAKTSRKKAAAPAPAAPEGDFNPTDFTGEDE